MKRRIRKKLKSISTITALRQGLVFRTTNLSHQYFQTSSPSKECENDGIQSEPVLGGRIPLCGIMKDVQEEEQAPVLYEDDKADFSPRIKSQEEIFSSLEYKEETGSTLQSPTDSVATFQPSDQVQLLAQSRNQKYQAGSILETGGLALRPLKVKVHQSHSDSTLAACFKLKDMEKCKMTDASDYSEAFASLREFEEKCPPEGSETIVFYTTSIRGIRKTFEDCKTIRFLLESFQVEYYERDVSMHLEYRQELWRIMGRKVVPPRLFIRGRFIGGADEVVGLHERGMLKKLLQGIPLIPSNCNPCNGCAGVRFVLCLKCNGSRKIITQGNDEPTIRCSECNENGLVKCPICSINK